MGKVLTLKEKRTIEKSKKLQKRIKRNGGEIKMNWDEIHQQGVDVKNMLDDYKYAMVNAISIISMFTPEQREAEIHEKLDDAIGLLSTTLKDVEQAWLERSELALGRTGAVSEDTISDYHLAYSQWADFKLEVYKQLHDKFVNVAQLSTRASIFLAQTPEGRKLLSNENEEE